MPRNSDHIEDPIERAAREEELLRYHFELFQPIWEFNPSLTPNWLIEDWIPKGALAILAGPPKSGKTSLATQLALAVATGTPFAGMPTKQAAVLWLSLEENFHERNFLLRDNPLAQSSTPFYTCFEPLPIDRETTFDALDFWVNQTQADLIVIDPLQAATSGRSLSDGHNARKILSMLKRYCHRRRVTALVLHHTKAPTHHNPRPRVADHDQLSATASMLMIMTVKEASPDAFLGNSVSDSDFPPHSQMAPSGDIVHEGGQGGETASHHPPTEPPSKKSEVKNLKSEIKENSQLRTHNSELPPVTRDPSPVPRLISLQCQGRGAHANRTVHFISTSPHDYRLADSRALIKTPEPRRAPFAAEQVVSLLQNGPADAVTICEKLGLNPFTVRHNLTHLRATGQVKLYQRDGNRNIYAHPSWTPDQVTESDDKVLAERKNQFIAEKEMKHTATLDASAALSRDLTRSKKDPAKRQNGTTPDKQVQDHPDHNIMFSANPKNRHQSSSERPQGVNSSPKPLTPNP